MLGLAEGAGVGLACQPRLTRQRPRQVLKLRRAGYDVNAAAQDATSPSAYAAEHAKVGDASLAIPRHLVTGAAKVSNVIVTVQR